MEIKITAVPLDAQRCRFTADRPVVVGGGGVFQSQSQAKGHPLAEDIFDIEGVDAVQLSGNQVVVVMHTPAAWHDVGKEIGRIIREYLISEAAHFEQALAGIQGNRQEQIRLKVQRVLDMQINPSVASHGGQITLLDVKDDSVYIKMEGGCQGCSSASATLKSGVEKAIRQSVPEVRAIFDTTDHASGKNPYYSPSH